MRQGRAAAPQPIPALLLLMLAGCSGMAGPRSPSQSVEYPWQEITAPQSVLVINGADDHQHRAHQVGSRYQEIVTFKNGASLFYEQLQGTHATFGVTGSDIIKSWYDGDSVKQAGFVYKANAVRRNAESFSLSDSGTDRTCALYGRVFGMNEGGFGNGDQLYRIQYCVRSGPNALGVAERTVAEIAARLEQTPTIARKPPILSLTP